MLALVGGGERPKFSQNTLVVYDGAKGEPAMDITFDAPIIETIMTKDTLIGIQINGVSVYSIPDGRLLLQVLHQFVAPSQLHQKMYPEGTNKQKLTGPGLIPRSQTRHSRPENGLGSCKCGSKAIN